MWLFVWLAFLHHAATVTPLKIDAKATIGNRDANKPQWVSDAVSKRPSLAHAAPMVKYCQTLKVFEKVEFPGNICFVSIWKDISLSTIKANPRRRFCESLAWGYNKEHKEACSMLKKSTAHCYGEYNIALHDIGFVPSLCPQFPCRDYKTLRTGISASPRNQVVHWKLPNDTSGSAVNASNFEATDLGYIRVQSAANTSIQSHTDCPSNMHGISYFWKASTQKSCTISSQGSSTSNPHERFIQQHCRDGAATQFVGCVFSSYEDCIAALADPEYVDIVDPMAVSVSLTIYIDLIIVGEKADPNMQQQQQDMANANGEDDSEFTVAVRINIAEFSFSLKEIRKNFRLCSDELFSLQNFIPSLDPSISLKMCLRMTNFQTFMPANGEIYVKFTPYFSVTVRKQGSSSSLGFAGGIEYKAADFVAYINMTKETNWMDKPDQSALVRGDLQWFKPVEHRPRSEYKSPPDYSLYVVLVFLGAMSVYFVLMFKNYAVLKRQENIHDKIEAQRVAHAEEKRLRHELWEKEVLEKEEKYKNELNAFVAERSEQLLNAENTPREVRSRSISIKQD